MKTAAPKASRSARATMRSTRPAHGTPPTCPRAPPRPRSSSPPASARSTARADPVRPLRPPRRRPGPRCREARTTVRHRTRADAGPGLRRDGVRAGIVSRGDAEARRRRGSSRRGAEDAEKAHPASRSRAGGPFNPAASASIRAAARANTQPSPLPPRPLRLCANHLRASASPREPISSSPDPSPITTRTNKELFTFLQPPFRHI